MDIRTYENVSIRSEETEDGKLRFSGYIAKFDEDSKELREYGMKFIERIAPGAFTRALERDDIKLLVNHDKAQVLGRNGIAEGQPGSLTLVEDETGLRFDAVATDTSYARDLHTNVMAGVIDACSFGFRKPKYKNSRRSDGKLVRELQDCELFDVSIVTYPAYNSTTASARSLEDVYKELEEELRDDGNPASETPEGDATLPISLLKKKLELKKKECF